MHLIVCSLIEEKCRVCSQTQHIIHLEIQAAFLLSYFILAIYPVYLNKIYLVLEKLEFVLCKLYLSLYV